MKPAPLHRRRDWRQSRRDLLRQLGLGAAALPLLHATSARAATPRRRLICVALAHGYEDGILRPPVGPLGTLPAGASALAPWKDQLVFLPDLSNPAYPTGRTGHGAYTTMFYAQPGLSGGDEYAIPARSTVDQVIADATGLRSLALHVQVNAEAAPRAARACFFRNGAAVTPLGDPFAVFQQLFGGAAPPAGTRQRLLEDRSLLDYAGKSLTRFARRLGKADQALVLAHLEAVRDMEKSLTGLDAASCSPPSPLGPPVAPDRASNYAPLLAAQLALMVAALRCGTTRVATLQLCDATGASARASFAGVPGGPGATTPTWYDLAHQPDGRGKAVLDRWCLEQLATLLARLQATPDLEGHLLDHTAVLWASSMRDARTHDSQRAPFLLAGRCGGHFKTGQCAASAGRPIGGVLSELCRALDVPGDPFGPPLAGLRA